MVAAANMLSIGRVFFLRYRRRHAYPESEGPVHSTQSLSIFAGTLTFRVCTIQINVEICNVLLIRSPRC